MTTKSNVGFILIFLIIYCISIVGLSFLTQFLTNIAGGRRSYDKILL